MVAGRELDALVAEKVMGSIVRIPEDGSGITLTFDPPPYSTDISAAWEVLEKAHAMGYVWVVEQASSCPFPTVHIINPDKTREGKSNLIHFIGEMEKISEEAKSPAHAICLAALKAVGP